MLWFRVICRTILGMVVLPSVLLSQTFTDMSHLLSPAAPFGTQTGQRGTSAADFNNDGLVDIYHANFRNPGRLYMNLGDSGFVDVLTDIDIDEGTNMWGAAFGDYDNDGYLDILFEDLSAPSKLYRNNRNLTFTEVNQTANVSILTLAQGAAWGDYNLDGLLDFFIVNDIGPNQLFKNLDYQTFDDVSVAANVQTFGNSYGTAWGDINNDGYPDAYIATCHRTDPLRSVNHLLLNNGDDTFTNIGSTAGVADSLPGWGVIWFDYDHDFDMDLYVTNSWHAPRLAHNRLYENNGDLTFTNSSFSSGLAGESTESSFGVSAADFDNDGWVDLYVTDLERPDRLYRNNGDGTFTDIAASAGITENEHRAVAVADFNNDGWIDIFTTGSPANLLLYNDGGSNHWLRIRTRGLSDNYHGVGARVEIYSGDLQQVDEIRAGDSFCSQNHDLTIHFGLGTNTSVDSLIIRWPTGGVDKLYDIAEVDREITVVQGGSIDQRPSSFSFVEPADGDTVSFNTFGIGDVIPLEWEAALDPDGDTLTYRIFLSGTDLWYGYQSDTILTGITGTSILLGLFELNRNTHYTWTMDVSDGTSITAVGQSREFVVEPFENLFAETAFFNEDEALLSTGSSWADYDNDGDQDLLITNDGNTANLLYRNDNRGTLIEQVNALPNDAQDSFSSTWGDYNRDGFPDIFIANTNGQNNALYLNSGDGTFSKISDGDIVNDGGSSMSAAWADYDQDGYLDLFVANTGNSANFLYRNQGASGGFIKVTEGAIVTDIANSFGASWGDFDNDRRLDLFVANTQTNSLYRNNGDGSFTALTSAPVVNDEAISRGGSWGDYDNDGDEDLYVTNLGNNFLYENTPAGLIPIVVGPHVSDGENSLSASWFDADLDGDLDLAVANFGNDRIYLNTGNKTFLELTNTGLLTDGSSHGTSAVDFDLNGTTDLFVAGISASEGNYIHRNQLSTNNWISIQCIGTNANTSGIGVHVQIETEVNGETNSQLRVISAQTGFSAQNPLLAHFGVGQATEVKRVEIDWLSGYSSIIENVAVNQYLTISEDSAVVAINADTPSSVPSDFILEQNYPNPFNPQTTIAFQLPKASDIRLAIYSLLGEQVAVLSEGRHPAGAHSVVWNGSTGNGHSAASGVYIYRLESREVTLSRKLLLIR